MYGVVSFPSQAKGNEIGRYRITMPDGSTTDELFESDNEAIGAAIHANLVDSQGITVER